MQIQNERDMGLIPKIPSKEQIAHELKMQRRREVREIAIALIQGGFQGDVDELIREAIGINDALKHI